MIVAGVDTILLGTASAALLTAVRAIAQNTAVESR
jgi:hypothetical protein